MEGTSEKKKEQMQDHAYTAVRRLLLALPRNSTQSSVRLKTCELGTFTQGLSRFHILEVVRSCSKGPSPCAVLFVMEAKLAFAYWCKATRWSHILPGLQEALSTGANPWPKTDDSDCARRFDSYCHIKERYLFRINSEHGWWIVWRRKENGRTIKPLEWYLPSGDVRAIEVVSFARAIEVMSLLVVYFFLGHRSSILAGSLNPGALGAESPPQPCPVSSFPLSSVLNCQSRFVLPLESHLLCCRESGPFGGAVGLRRPCPACADSALALRSW